MKKFHVYPAIKGGSPLPLRCRSRCTIASSERYICTATLRPQKAGEAKASLEVAAPLPSRAKRLRDTTNELEGLYQRSPASGSNEGYTAGVREMGGKQYGVPISREVLEKGFIRPGYRYRRTEFNTVASPAIAGARKLAARPQAAQSVQRQALTRVQGSALGMSVRLKVVDDTSTPNFSDRDPRREDRGQIRSNRRDTSGLPDKQRFPTSTSRIDNSFHIRTLKNENMSNRFSRADKTARPPDRNRSGRPRASPSRGDEREPGRRKRDAGGGSSDGYNKFDRKLVWTEEEKQYLEEKKKKESPQMLPFEPVDVNRQTFSGSGPAIAMGEWGMNEALRERLLLAKKHLVGESIQWDSKEQKAEVMTLVEKLRVVKRTEPAGKKEAEDGKVSPPSDSDLHTEALMQKLFGGIYGKFRPLGQKDVLGHVERYVHRNESYFPDDEISLLDKRNPNHFQRKVSFPMRASSKQAAMRAKLPSTLFTTLSQPHHTPSYLRIVLPPSRIPHPPLPQFAPHRTLTTTAPRFKRVGKKKSKRTVPFNVTKAGGNDASAFDFSDYEARIARAHSVLKSELAGIKAGGSGRDAEAIEGLRVQLVKAGNGSSGKRETVALGDVASVVSRGRNVGVIVGERDHLKPVLATLAGSPAQLNPTASPTDPLTLTIPIPPTTAESRQEAKALAGKKGEEAAFALREARGAQRKRHRSMELEKLAGPDELRRAEREVERVNKRAVGDARKMVEGCRKGLDGG